MVPTRTGGGNNIDYSLGQIDAKLHTITQTLSEDRLSDAQFRTWVRERIEHLERQSNQAEGRGKAYSTIWGIVQFAVGLIGGSVAVLVERMFHTGKTP